MKRVASDSSLHTPPPPPVPVPNAMKRIPSDPSLKMSRRTVVAAIIDMTAPRIPSVLDTVVQTVFFGKEDDDKSMRTIVTNKNE